MLAPIENLVRNLGRLPGLGRRSAGRAALELVVIISASSEETAVLMEGGWQEDCLGHRVHMGDSEA